MWQDTKLGAITYPLSYTTVPGFILKMVLLGLPPPHVYERKYWCWVRFTLIESSSHCRNLWRLRSDLFKPTPSVKEITHFEVSNKTTFQISLVTIVDSIEHATKLNPSHSRTSSDSKRTYTQKSKSPTPPHEQALFFTVAKSD